MAKVALITGITGQDGAYLAEFLLKKGYIVHGIKRRSSLINTDRVDHLYEPPHITDRKFILHYGDLADALSLVRIVKQVQPDEIYNLGAMSHVKVSFELPEYTANVDGIGALRLLEAVRFLGMEKKTKIYQASTSELFGLVQETPQRETTPFYPRSPYGVAKLYAYWATINYREAYGMFACNGILFNHESPIRGETFVTRKITRAVARMATGGAEILSIGNLNAKRDWGHARDYVEAMWKMLQQDVAEDFVIATGITTTVREFIVMAFAHIGVEIQWSGEGLSEIGKVKSSKDSVLFPVGRQVVSVDPAYFRPTEVDMLVGDATKAKEKLGWVPTTPLSGIVSEMMEYDIAVCTKEKILTDSGFTVRKQEQ